MTEAESTKAKPGRKPRFTREQLRERTLRSAVDSVLQNGVAGGVDSIRIEHVIVDADVPRAPAYELWDEEGSDTPQQNLRRAAIKHFIYDLPLENFDKFQAELLNVLEQQAEELRQGNEDYSAGHREGLDAVMTETIRLISQYALDELQTADWRVYNALVASIRTRDDEELLEVMRNGEMRLLDNYEALFTGMGDLFHWKSREPSTDRIFALAVHALAEGLFNRTASNLPLDTVMIDGKEWSVFGLGMSALIRELCEPIPASEMTAAASKVQST